MSFASKQDASLKDAYLDVQGELARGRALDGWCVIVRPDRTVLNNGPLAEVDRVLREALTLLGNVAEKRSH